MRNVPVDLNVKNVRKKGKEFDGSVFFSPSHLFEYLHRFLSTFYGNNRADNYREKGFGRCDDSPPPLI